MEAGFKITKNGLKVLNHLRRIDESFRIACREGLEKTGELLTSGIEKGILEGKKTGRIYNGIQASKAGEYTAERTGALRKSYGFEVEGGKMRYGSDSEIGLYTELGTKKKGGVGWRMKPRHNIEQTSKKNEQTILQLMTNCLDTELKRGS